MSDPLHMVSSIAVWTHGRPSARLRVPLPDIVRECPVIDLASVFWFLFSVFCLQSSDFCFLSLRRLLYQEITVEGLSPCRQRNSGVSAAMAPEDGSVCSCRFLHLIQAIVLCSTHTNLLCLAL